ncbi:MAG: hypothetical protein M0T84_12635 [Betaproteobacteria bacterium]|nr:hypothetical protein [Betaproteobacteria bacterium]
MGFAIMAASRLELAPLTTRLKTAGEWLRLPSGDFAALCGIGAPEASHIAAQLLDQGVWGLVSWGCATGLEASLRPGTLLLPRTLATGHAACLRVDAAWHRAAIRALAPSLPIRTAPIADAESLLTSPAQKEALFQRTGGIAADMESAMLARIAQECHMPFLVVRAVADTAVHTLPRGVPIGIDACGNLAVGRIARHALLRPADWPQLARLGLAFRRARQALGYAASRMPHAFTP